MIPMWLAGASVAAVAVAVVGAASAQGVAQTAPAQKAAIDWLALVDAGNYDRSWDRAAGFFRRAVARDKWDRTIAAVREPLGALESRKLKSAVSKKQLPGAPDGDYVVIQYRSRFAHKAEAIETVTAMRESDGSWKMAGYFVK